MQPRVALIVETSKAFGRGALIGIGRYSQLQGRWSLHAEERSLDDPIPAWLGKEHFDGLILRARDRKKLLQVLELGVPTVCLGEDFPPGCPRVVVDDSQTGKMAFDYLFERDFEVFGYVGIEGYEWSNTRRDAFAAEARKQDKECLVFEPERKSQHAPRWDRIQKHLQAWVAQLPQPIGVMCCHDALARMLIDVCRLGQVSVPEGLAVIGVDNDPVLCELSVPSLTSIKLDTFQIGYEAASILDRLMHGEAEQAVVTVPPLGVISRESTDTLSIADPQIAAALSFIRRHAAEGIQVSDILRAIPLSRRTLERRFRELTGTTPLEEITRVKLQRVKQMLSSTNLKLNAIARHCGFAYAAYMTTQFQRAFGATPGEYRKAAALETHEQNGPGPGRQEGY